MMTLWAPCESIPKNLICSRYYGDLQLHRNEYPAPKSLSIVDTRNLWQQHDSMISQIFRDILARHLTRQTITDFIKAHMQE